MPGRFSSACFDGNYPIELPRQTALGEHVINNAGQCRPNRRQSS